MAKQYIDNDLLVQNRTMKWHEKCSSYIDLKVYKLFYVMWFYTWIWIPRLRVSAKQTERAQRNSQKEKETQERQLSEREEREKPHARHSKWWCVGDANTLEAASVRPAEAGRTHVCRGRACAGSAPESWRVAFKTASVLCSFREVFSRGEGVMVIWITQCWNV